MNEYYSEKIEKDTSYRAAYIDGIESFLENSKRKTDEVRRGFITPEKYKSAPEFYREKFTDMLGFPLREKREKPVVNKYFVATDRNVDIYRMTFSFKSGLYFYGIYFEQKEDKGEKPFVIGLHGGAGTPELVSSIYLNSTNYNHLVRRLTDKGASVFAPQLLLWNVNDYGNAYDRLSVDGKMRQLGGTITALELYLMQCALDYFLAEENIDKNKVGVAGMSYGGMYALHLAALDTRIKSCYSCSWVCEVFKWVKPDWCYQSAQNTFAVAETAALIAPRPLVAAMGTEDPAYQLGFEKECEKILPYYRALGKEKNFKFVKFSGSHEVDKSDEELQFFINAIK